MPRKRGGKTLDLDGADDAELLLLCAENHDAEKKWLGGVFLRYGMNHPAEALAEEGATSAKRTRKRRDAKPKDD